MNCMTTHVINMDRYCASAEGVRGRLVLGTWGSYGIEALQLLLGDGWAGRTVTVVFHGPKTSASTTVLAGSDGLVDVPQEATAAAGYGTITIVGVDADSQRISVDVPYVVMAHAPVTGQAPDPTPDIWQQFVAAVKADADRAEQAAGDAADSAAAAAKSAEAAAESAKQAEQAGADIGEAKDAALEAIQQAQDTGVQAIQTAHRAALDDIATDRQQALTDIEGAGDKQQSAITSSGAAALEAIGRVEQAAIGQVQQAGAAQVDAVNAAGQAQLDKIDAANALLPTPTEADAGKAVVVRADGSGYELGKVQTDAYTKAESDARYAPIAAAIRPTVSGNPATLEHSVAWAMQGLSVYGKSTQDGEPSPDNPVPIVSAGESGSIAVNVSDGTDQSQQLSIQTPNGLPGIPVGSGGNYTDVSGQQWVCDEIDLKRGKYVKRVEKIVIDGEEMKFTQDVSGLYWNLPRHSAEGVMSRMPIMSMYFPRGIFSANDTYDFIYTMPASIGSYFLSVNDLNEFCTEKSAEGQPLELYYVIDPIETDLPAEELSAYAALRTYDGTTVVATDAPVAGLSARYVADGAAYIDSKIQAAVTQAVAAAVSLTGGAQ